MEPVEEFVAVPFMSFSPTVPVYFSLLTVKLIELPFSLPSVTVSDFPPEFNVPRTN
jgi:hypothetical protein